MLPHARVVLAVRHRSGINSHPRGPGDRRRNRRRKRPRDATSIASSSRIFGSRIDLSSTIPNTYTCSHRFCPQPDLSYEQMFPSPNSSLARRALDALRLTRSFLTLEDDYSVDWEVDRDEPSREAPHPHRAPLRGGFVRRPPGEPGHPPQICLSPVASSTITAPGRAHRPSEMLCELGVLRGLSERTGAEDGAAGQRHNARG